MGILTNTDNNIIVDAVLTDAGRHALAQNRGLFNIVRVKFGDDGVDYTWYSTYGRTIAQEKIEKNSIIFQASTDQNIAMKSTCFSVSNPNLIRLPAYELQAENSTSGVITLGRFRQRSSIITLTQIQENTDALDIELQDTILQIKLDNRFLQLDGLQPNIIDNKNIATYVLRKQGAVSAINGSIFGTTIRSNNLTDEDFTVNGDVDNKQQITSIVVAQSRNTGARKDITVVIQKNT
jgi:hypothetical protein